MHQAIKHVSILALIIQLAACGSSQENQKVSSPSDKADSVLQCSDIQTWTKCTGQCRWIQCPANANCLLPDRCEPIPDLSSCLFGSYIDDEAAQERFTVTSEQEFYSTEGIDALLEQQIMTAAEESTGSEYRDLQEVIDHSEENQIVVLELSAADGRTFRSITFYPGDNAYGAIFRSGETEFVATFADRDFTSCREKTVK